MTRYALGGLIVASFGYFLVTAGMDPLIALGIVALIAGIATFIAIARAVRGAA